MPRKAFVADLQQVQAHSPHPAVTNIKKGDDDGSFTFSVTPTASAKPIEVTALIPELSDYPSEHECVLFITSEGASQAVSDAIESLNVRATKVQNIITATAAAICSKRGVKRQHSSDSKSDPDAMDVDSPFDDEDPDADGEEAFGFGDDDDYGSIEDGWSPAISENGLTIEDSQVAGSADPMQSEYIKEFCSDLRTVKSSGFKVGVIGSLPGGSGYLAISIRIAKLGISDEAMTAWRLNPDKYLVLLMHYPQGYKPFSVMAKDSYTAKRWLQIYVGTSSTYKPSQQEAITAFTKVKKFKEDQDGNIHIFKGEGGRLDVHGLSDSQPNSSTHAATTFEGTFISRPVSELLNERLLALVMYRISFGFGWDGAELFYEDFQGRERTDSVDDRYYQQNHGPSNLPPLSQSDSLNTAEERTDVVFPLVAMQYLLRHFVRCTEFCLVCHNKINANFEALKPYVCDKPLCLYQYMALGFGPSMEYEILDQPSVIDLLISFCWFSAAHGKLSEFPTGLNLTVPSPGPLSLSAVYDRVTQELSIAVIEGETPKLSTGDWIVMMAVSGSEMIHCRVTDGEYYPLVRLSVLPTSAQSQFVQQVDAGMNFIDTKIAVTYGVYGAHFDDLSASDKRNSVVQMLETLPSVNEMRDWLVLNTKVGEEISLKSWKNKISPSALLLLRWIVASNRSCIVQIDQTPDDPFEIAQTETPPDVASSVAETKDKKKSIIGEERVHGMDGYIQFRFAMGAPDKEQRFVNEVKTAVQTNGLAFPTLFAFHGSPIWNWHSIIREGLHFRETAHGRAYGNGVYHSLDASVSLGYTGSSYRPSYSSSLNSPSTGQRWWSKSHLCINSAMCLNEIVNLPAAFVSRSPHLVVDKVDWIQTRYLFVQTGRPTTAPAQQTVPAAPVPARVLPQDPAMTPRGIGHKNLVIPETASTVRTRSGNSLNISHHLCQPSPPKKSKLSSTIGRIVRAATGSFTDPITIEDDGYASAATDADDLRILTIDDKGKGKDKGASTAKDSKKKDKKKDTNAFVPGQLDIASIQLLEEPPYASPLATKRIQQELKALLKIQQTHDLEELGWYINHEHIQNVYQWIIELHSFESSLPLAEDMKKSGVNSIVMEVRFGKDFPMTPPFFRVISPRFLPFQRRGGGHVTAGGALCMELLTNSGWSAVSSLESVFLQIRLAMSSLEPYPARLDGGAGSSYSTHEAKDAFVRACRTHGWQVPPDFNSII
ncbi:Ubiquitin-conjugating enzyme [Drechslerella dactyloides]|uniref:Ubiquitin-conjugating enzyme n=1 Tax=Drechslerella dactyloides TaxID=74499 RepID=A0AAD6NGA7_DREDA|nr:Ubiquitin-conjugating enzyme [Drechslerella dactyloides]